MGSQDSVLLVAHYITLSGDGIKRALLRPLNAFVSSSKLHTKSALSAGLAWSIEL